MTRLIEHRELFVDGQEGQLGVVISHGPELPGMVEEGFKINIRPISGTQIGAYDIMHEPNFEEGSVSIVGDNGDRFSLKPGEIVTLPETVVEGVLFRRRLIHLSEPDDKWFEDAKTSAFILERVRKLPHAVEHSSNEPEYGSLAYWQSVGVA